MNLRKHRSIVFILATGGLLTLAIVIVAIQPARAAGPWYVAPGGDDGNDCLSPASPCATINAAIGKASPGDTIYVAIGIYTATGDAVVLLDRDATLSGGWDDTFTTQIGFSIIDGEETRRGVTVNSSVTATLAHLVVQNASDYHGGGITNAGVLTLNNCTVTDNYGGGSVGGINNGGTLIVNDSIISNNVMGGIDNQGTLILNYSTVSGNTSNYPWNVGGGIRNSGVVTLNSSSITNNWNIHGGGLHNNYGTVTLHNSVVTGNTSGNKGGGIYSDNGIVNLNNSTVSGNTASGIDGLGGGIFNMGGTFSLNSCTVSGNVAFIGGGISGDVLGGATTMQNTIVSDNVALSGDPDCSTSISSYGHNLIGKTSGCAFTPGPGDLTNVDPKLDPFGGSPGYHPLLPDSPAINAGNPAGCTDHLANLLTTDQRGFPRFDQCDMGAYELQPIGFSTKTSAVTSILPGALLTYTITLPNGGVADLLRVRVTDTLPISLTYTLDSLSATSGSYEYASRIITWTGSVNAGSAVTISFGVEVTESLGSIINSAVISGGGEIITRTATVHVVTQVYLPVVLKSEGQQSFVRLVRLTIAPRHKMCRFRSAQERSCYLLNRSCQSCFTNSLGDTTNCALNGEERPDP